VIQLKLRVGGEWVDIPTVEGVSLYDQAVSLGYPGTMRDFQEALGIQEAPAEEIPLKVGSWPVAVGSYFGGARIIAADSLQGTITLQWKKQPLY
jgi:hypothetical protein